MRNTFLLLTLFCLTGISIAQVGIGTAKPSPVAALHIKPKGNQGMIIPSVKDYTAVLVDILDNEDKGHAAGLIVFSTNHGQFYMWDSAKWQCVNPFVTNSANKTIEIAKPYTTISGKFTGSVNGTLRAVGENSFEGNGTVPVGGIIMWSGNADSIENGSLAGWKLCNGIGTYTDKYGDTIDIPNLRGKFVIGYKKDSTSNFNAIGRSAGKSVITLRESDLPPHNHEISNNSNNSGGHQHGFSTSTVSLGVGVSNYFLSADINSTPGYFWGNYRDNTGELTPYGRNSSSYIYNNSLIDYVPDHRHSIYGNTGNGNGTSSPINNLPPYYVIAYIIRVQ